ncbi:unnamed protein product [Effrenium voratum]|uniref:Apple domain-containing protein n=1 Tax=Effrenium voratum TaxID=2562239 RepID=A0AA36MN53_9DINO|nr:unnamed protein product [Effrenium voratum]
MAAHMIPSEEEELLNESRGRSFAFPTRVAMVVGSFALAGSALALRFTPSRGARAAPRSFLGLEEEPACFQKGMYWADPYKMGGTERSVELGAVSCQGRCQSVPGCRHFSFWPDGGCMLTSEDSSLEAAPFKYSDVITGPKFCDKADDAPDAPAGPAGEAQSVWGAGTEAANAVQSGIQQAADAVSGAADAASQAIEDLTGVNGTACEAYPACVAVGITGECCPNVDTIRLGCCDGFPKVVEAVTIAAGTECSKFPTCTALNMTGGCCPTPDGVMLGCCTQI